MIRQAISCDICAAEKRQTNHWFVAYEQGGELRVSGWTSRHRLKPDAKHLCGQTCLHKLIDEYIAKSIAARAQRGDTATTEAEASLAADTSLIHSAAVEIESSARLMPASKPASPRAPKPISKPAPAPISKLTVAPVVPAPVVEHPHPEIVTMPARSYPKDVPPLPPDTLRYASRRWHAEAWERERERELRAGDDSTKFGGQRRTSA